MSRYFKPSKILLAVENGNLKFIKEYYESHNIVDLDTCIKAEYPNGAVKHFYKKVSPMELALKYNHLDMFNYLVDNTQTLPKDILYWCIEYDKSELITELFEKGASLEATGGCHGCMNLYSIAICKHSYDTLVTLCELGVNVKTFGSEALSYALKGIHNCNGDIDFYIKVSKYLIEHGADINIADKHSYEPHILHLTRFNKVNMELINYLLEHGADISATNWFGETAYHIALQSNKFELAKYYKSLGDKTLHSLDFKIAQFKEFGCPQSMIDFFMKENNTFKSRHHNIYFYHITDVPVFNFAMALSRKYYPNMKEMPKDIFEYNNHEFLSLVMKFSETYDNNMLWLWSKDLKTICQYDIETYELLSVGTWEDFQSNLEKFADFDYSETSGKKHIGDWITFTNDDGSKSGDIYWEDL